MGMGMGMGGYGTRGYRAAVGRFAGMVAERVDLRYFLALGMLISAVFCYLFGLARTYQIHHISYYILVQVSAEQTTTVDCQHQHSTAQHSNICVHYISCI